MKVTKRQLRRIIKEVSPHPGQPGSLAADEIAAGFEDAIGQLIWDEWAAAGISPEESPEEVGYVKQALQNILADLESGRF